MATIRERGIDPRGYAIIALVGPKFAANVGGVLRACHNFRASQLSIANCRAADLKSQANTPRAHRHIPTFLVSDPLERVPVGCKVVAVDLVEGATPLPTFVHPMRAVYVFGPEDGTLGPDVIGRADHSVMIPTRNCMNLASTVSVVLYDRMAKQ